MMWHSRVFGYMLHKFLRDGCFSFSRLYSQQYIYFYQKINWSSRADNDPDEWRTGQRLLFMFVLQCQNPLHQKTLLLHSKMFVSFCWFVECYWSEYTKHTYLSYLTWLISFRVKRPLCNFCSVCTPTHCI